MKKTLVALAALAATASFAQSSVTIYGRLDAGYANQTLSQTNTSGVSTDTRQNGVTSHNNVSSLWGLMGEEDLGSGLKAQFKLEQDVFIANGNVGVSGAGNGASSAAAFDRISYVGATGGFGTVRFGRDYNPTFALAAGTDVFNQSNLTTVGLSTGAIGGGISSKGAYTLLGTSAISNTSAGNSLTGGVGSSVAQQFMYISPNLNGFVGTLFVQSNDTGTSAADSATGGTSTVKAVNGSLTYTNGPLFAGYATGTKETAAWVAAGDLNVNIILTPILTGAANATAGLNTVKAELNVLGASYDFGKFKLVGNYITARHTISTLSGDISGTEANLGVIVPMGNVNLLAQVGNNTAKANIGGANLDASGTDAIVGAEYVLSKRTALSFKAGTMNKFSTAGSAETSDTKRVVTSLSLKHTF